MPLDDRLKELTPPEQDSMLPEAELEEDPSEAWQALLEEAKKPIDGMADTAAERLKVKVPPPASLLDAVGDALEEFAALLPGERYLTHVGTSSDSTGIRIYSRNGQRQTVEDSTRKSLDEHKADLAKYRDTVSAYEARSGLEKWCRAWVLWKHYEKHDYEVAKKSVQEHEDWVSYLELKLDTLTANGWWADDNYAVYPHCQDVVGYSHADDRGQPEFLIEVQPFVDKSVNETNYRIARALACHLRKAVKDLDISLTAHSRHGSDKDWFYRVPLSQVNKKQKTKTP